MRIVIVGSGNVAYHLVNSFREKNIVINQIFGRNEHDLKEISQTFSIPFSTSELADADLYILAVNDGAISEVSKKITAENCLVAHTSGSLPREVLVGKYRKASFYPLQTFSKKAVLNYSEIPFFIEAEEDSDFEMLSSLASRVSENVIKSTHEKRKYVHLTAVFACNFVNHLYARAKEISDSRDIPFQYFLPLISETTSKIYKVDPKSAQTGPAVRKDSKVLELHESLITDEEHLKIYRTMNESIRKMYEL